MGVMNETFLKTLENLIHLDKGITVALIGKAPSFLLQRAFEFVRSDTKWNSQRETEDLLVVQPSSGNIGIDDILDVERFLLHKPANGKKKYVVIHRVERLTPEASNAFLKTLEEPPEFATLILTTTSWESLLPTIRSRSIFFEMDYPYEMLDALKKKYREDVKYIYAGCFEDFEVLKHCLDNDVSQLIEALKSFEQLNFQDLVTKFEKLTDSRPEEYLMRRKFYLEVIRRIVSEGEHEFFKKFVVLKKTLNTNGNYFHTLQEIAAVLGTLIHDSFIISRTSRWNLIQNLELLEWLMDLDLKNTAESEEVFLWCQRLSRLKIGSLNRDLILHRILYSAREIFVKR